MYQLLLIFKYLTRKIAPMFATLAVCLCSAMVIIVMSIMGGFLTTMETSLQKLDADVTVTGGTWGIEKYEQLVERIEALDEVESATAMIRTMGMIKLSDLKAVEVFGIDTQSYGRVFDFENVLYWDSQTISNAGFPHTETEPTGKPGADLAIPAEWKVKENTRAAVVGIHVNPFSQRDEKGQYHFANASVANRATLTVFPTQKGGTIIEPMVGNLVVVNELKSGLYEFDKSRVYVPLDMLQAMLYMDAKPAYDAETGEPTGQMTNARVTQVMVRGKQGVDLLRIKAAVEDACRGFLEHLRDTEGLRMSLWTYTWREKAAGFLGAVENEKAMVSFLFLFISVVAFVMIAVVFYMIAKDKTRDIGTLRAIGASRLGIGGIFLGYGLIVGVIGSLLGLWLAYEIVTRINDIQAWLANGVGVTIYYAACILGGAILGALLGGIVGFIKGRPMNWMGYSVFAFAVIGVIVALVTLNTSDELASTLNANIRFSMWNPQTYYFDRIPAVLNKTEIAIIIPVYIIASVLGALVPAYAAGRTKPVEALRYE